MKTYQNAGQLIGATPLIHLNRLQKHLGLQADILVKLEGANPAGSVKDRIARAMVDAAEASGQLKPGGLLVEASSGNTGIGLAMVAAARGYKLMLTMPDTMSLERRQLLAAYGAQLVLTPGAEGMPAAMAKAEEITAQHPGSVYVRQFDNPANPQVHYDTTGPEIEQAAHGRVDVFVSGVGTGGTITGAGRYLKERHPNLEIVAVEPETSAVLSGKPKGKHKIQGIGAGFVPRVLDTGIYNRVMTASDEEAAQTARLLATTEGLLCGISSGAALSAAIKLAKENSYHGKSIVVVLPDAGNRYLSTGLFETVTNS
ncbi:MAG: cysteine synthase A [Clostridiales bacterium]|jgi:cysteine synthase A|nr:cysteine synthase A [Clostridiales bacterium]